MSNISFRTKLTLLNAFVVLACLLGIGLGLVYSTRTSVLQSIDNDMQFRAAQLTRGIPPALGGLMPGNPQQGPPPGEGPGGFGGPGPDEDRQPAERPIFFNSEGKVVAPSSGALALDPETLRIRFGPLVMTTVVYNGIKTRVVTVPVVRQGQFLGHLQFGRSLEEYDRLVAAQARLLFILIPLAVVIATLSGSFLASRALKPVMEVTDAAGHISTNDLSLRLKVSGSDELAVLAKTFNEMVERLQISFTQREKLLQELEAALNKQRQFVADASHELRTPLARIKLTTSSALSQEGDEEELRKSLQIADDAADVMGRLVQQLLSLARMDSSVADVTSVPVDVSTMIEQTIKSFDGSAGARIVSEVDHPFKVLADNDDIVRCLSNLIENSRRYTSQEGVIKVRAWAEGSRGILQVSDTGSGIPAEHLPKVTERFYRVDEARSRKDGGCGLGLAICKAIAERHHGELKIESEVGCGTSASIYLPLAQPK